MAQVAILMFVIHPDITLSQVPVIQSLFPVNFRLVNAADYGAIHLQTPLGAEWVSFETSAPNPLFSLDYSGAPEPGPYSPVAAQYVFRYFGNQVPDLNARGYDLEDVTANYKYVPHLSVEQFWQGSRPPYDIGIGSLANPSRAWLNQLGGISGQSVLLDKSVALLSVMTSMGGPGTESHYPLYWIAKLPEPLDSLTTSWKFADGKYQASIDLPVGSGSQEGMEVPFLGKVKGEMDLNLEFSYDTRQRNWKLSGGYEGSVSKGKPGRRPKIPGFKTSNGLALYIGNRKLEGSIKAGVEGTASTSDGLKLEPVFAEAKVAGRFELTRYGVLDVFPPLGLAVDALPWINRSDVEPLRIVLYAVPSLAGEIKTDASLRPLASEIKGQLALEAQSEVDLWFVEGSFTLGGRGFATLQSPANPLLKDVAFELYGKAKIEAGAFDYSGEWIVFRYPEGSASALVPIASNTRFVQTAKPKVGVIPRARQIEQKRAASEGAAASPQETPVTANILPSSTIARAVSGLNSMSLFLVDDQSDHPLQFTDVGFVWNDASGIPVTGVIDGGQAGDFYPTVAFDGNGDVIAVWERFSDSTFATVDPAAAAPLMELVWAKWNPVALSWSVPQPLTNNTHLDMRPSLTGPMAGGEVLAVWVDNAGNVHRGTEASPSSLKYRIWNPATSQWSAAATIATGLISFGGFSVSSSSNGAICGWITDADGLSATTNDREVYFATLNGGTWGPVTRATTNADQESALRVTTANDGAHYLFWKLGNQLKIHTVATSTTTDTGADFANGFEVSSIAPGRFAFGWKQDGTDGPALWISILSQIGANLSWVGGRAVGADTRAEKDYALTTNGSQITVNFTAAEITTDGGVINDPTEGLIAAPGLPVEGQVDVYLEELVDGSDFAVVVGGVKVVNSYQYGWESGKQSQIAVEVDNRGLRFGSTVVKIYSGSVETGALLGQSNVNLTAPGVQEVLVTFTCPTPLPTLISAKVDPDGLISEGDETNNVGVMDLSATDLVIQTSNPVVNADGSITIAYKVFNYGATASGPFSVELLQRGVPGIINSQGVAGLAGTSNVIGTFTLPAGTQYQTELWFTTRIAGEVSTDPDADTNNKETFSALSMHDADKDGILDHVEDAVGLDKNNAADATLDSDGDGTNNLAESIAGTGITDGTSRFVAGLIPGSVSSAISLSWVSARGRVYRVEKSSDLITWIPHMSGIVATPPSNQVSIAPDISETGMFYRVVIE